MFIISVILYPLPWKYTYKMYDIISHYGGFTCVQKSNCLDYISYIDILFTYK